MEDKDLNARLEQMERNIRSDLQRSMEDIKLTVNTLEGKMSDVQRLEADLNTERNRRERLELKQVDMELWRASVIASDALNTKNRDNTVGLWQRIAVGLVTALVIALATAVVGAYHVVHATALDAPTAKQLRDLIQEHKAL